MRKLFSLFVALLPTTALWAYDFQSGDLYYNITSDTTVEVTSQSPFYPYNEGVTFTTATIPETVTYNGTTYSVTSIGGVAFYNCSSLTSVTIPESVTSIGGNAFDRCSSLTSITIPNSVMRIGVGAFDGTGIYNDESNWENNVFYIDNCLIKTYSISGSYTIKENTRLIADYAFLGCRSLTSITIPNSVTSIGKEAFVDCSSLTSITIPSCVRSIGDGAFVGCFSFTSIVVENGNTAYDSRENCNAIIETATNTLIAGCQNTFIPNSVTSIGNGAFEFCTSLTSITIPSSVTSIGRGAFARCSSLASITIPNSVTTIGNYAFSDCSSLTSITIGNSVTSIGDNAFSDCSSLTSITIGNSVTSIGDNAFYRCSSLASVTIPNSVNSIGNSAFYGCSSLTSVTIGNSVTSIGERAFQYCSSITSIVIPNSVTSIGNSAFYDCSSLSLVTLTAPSVEAFCNGQGNNLLRNAGCHASRKIAINGEIITSITIPNSVTSIGDCAFLYCSSLTSITIPNSVTSIGSSAFYDCDALDSIRVEATTPPVLESYAFSYTTVSLCYIPCGTSILYKVSDWAQCVDEFVEVGCDICGDDLRWEYDGTQLSITGYGEMYDYDIDPQPWQESRNKITQLSLPDGMTSVGAAAFADCKFLNNATIPSSVKEIRYSAFEDCRMLATLTFAEPSTLISIGNWAFYNNHELKSVVIPDGVTEIGYAAFYGCTYLKELTLPASMQSVADNGFALCAKLRRMNVNATTPPQVEARTFEDVDRTIPVVVPDESVSVYKSAPIWQEFNIVGKSGVPAALDNIPAENSATRKLLRDGNLVIIRDGVEYNVMGQKL